MHDQYRVFPWAPTPGTAGVLGLVAVGWRRRRSLSLCQGDDMLLARNAAGAWGFYSTLAGFVAPTESVEQTVHRDAFGEDGTRVQNLSYLGR